MVIILQKKLSDCIFLLIVILVIMLRDSGELCWPYLYM